MTEKYFFDSYAILEVVFGNPNYKKYFDVDVVTTKLNLFEVYHSLVRRLGHDLAQRTLNAYYEDVLDFDKKTIVTGAMLKMSQKQLSMADCIGYILSLQLGIKFLTGDKAFEHMENVEFVR